MSSSYDDLATLRKTRRRPQSFCDSGLPPCRGSVALARSSTDEHIGAVKGQMEEAFKMTNPGRLARTCPDPMGHMVTWVCPSTSGFQGGRMNNGPQELELENCLALK